MTYCVAMNLADGLVFVSDSRTNAGVDHIATFRKLNVFAVPNDRLIVIQTAGNLATSQSVLSRLRSRLDTDVPNLHNVSNLFDAAELVGRTLHEIQDRDRNISTQGDLNLTTSIIMGGQIGRESPRLFNVYPQGNFIESVVETPYFQIGESKYGKPILDRALTYQSPLEQALRCALISFDSTIRSNLSVGMPLDVLVYQRDSLTPPQGYRVTENDPYFQNLSRHWSDGIRNLLGELPSVPQEYWI